MAIIAGVTVRWRLSPRQIVIPTAETEVTLEDLQDTLQDLEDDVDGMVFPHLREMAGGEDLGGGTTVGFTMELQNSQLMWDTNVTVPESGTVTTPDTSGVTLTDSTALFVTNGVVPGDMVVNSTDGSHATVTDVVSETEVTTDGLQGGTDDQFASADGYQLFSWILRNVTGGNLVATDTGGSPIEPVLPSFGNYLVRTSSSSATLQELDDIQHASFDGHINVDVTSSNSGTEYPNGNTENPVNNWADAVAINAVRNFDAYAVLKSTTLDVTQDYTDASFVGKSIIDTVLTIPVGTLLDKAEFFNVSIEGTLGDVTIMQNCFLGETNTLNEVQGVIEDCSIGPAKLTLGGTSTDIVRFVDCRGAGSAFAPPTINCGGNGPEVDIQAYVGQVNIENKTGEAVFEISIDGKLTLDSTVTSGTIIVNGTGVLENNSGTGATVINNMVQGIQLQELWKVQGLEFGNPMTVTTAERSVQDQSISLALTGDGEFTRTVTRQTDQTVSLDAPLVSDLVDNSDSALTPTFVRASTGWYIDSASNDYTSAVTDTARFELEGLLLEEARTNLVTQSSAVDDADWAKGANAIITQNVGTGLNGNVESDRYDVNTASSGEITQSVTTTASTDYTASRYVKYDGDGQWWRLMGQDAGASGDQYRAWFDIQNSVAGNSENNGSGVLVNAGIDEHVDSWYRIHVSGQHTGTSTRHWMRPATGDDATGHGTGQIEVWGNQMEIGRFPTSPIETTTAQVTRAADFLTYNDDAVVFNSAGSIYVELTPLYDSDVANSGVIVNIINQLAGPMYVFDDAGVNKIAINDGTNTASLDPGFVRGTTYKCAVRWNATLNEMQVIVAGSAGTKATYDGAFVRAAGTLYVGSSASANHFNGNIRNLKIYNIDRGETQLLVDTA